MQIENMSQQDQIMIQGAKIINQNYSINWLASVYYQDILVCFKSSWISYDELKTILEDHCDELRYQGLDVYWEKVTKQTSLHVLTQTIKPPVDVILLPIKNNAILIPSSEETYRNLQRTIKGVIKCIKERKTSLFGLNATENLKFLNDSLPLQGEEIVAEYIVDNHRYPVTVAMLGQTISVQIPKNTTCESRIVQSMSNKYNLIKSEE